MASVVVTGIGTTVNMLINSKTKIKSGTKKGLSSAAHFLEGEVKSSIAGRRAEPASVDTGRFLGSINTAKKGSNSYSIQDGVEYGKFLEYGTSRVASRPHFRNSLNRSRAGIIKIVKDAIK